MKNPNFSSYQAQNTIISTNSNQKNINNNNTVIHNNINNKY